MTPLQTGWDDAQAGRGFGHSHKPDVGYRAGFIANQAARGELALPAEIAPGFEVVAVDPEPVFSVTMAALRLLIEGME